jgi:Ca-activated chloride channel homolog
MNWLRAFSEVEWTLIGFFIIAYLLFAWRMYRISKVLKTSIGGFIFKFLLRSMAFSLLIAALLGPLYGESKKEIKTVGKDIYIAIDLSESMNAFDIPPTRLEKVKFELKKVISAFNSDRISLIIFSSEAFMQCPLTYDQNALNMFLEALHSDLVPSTGTDFAPALNMAMKKITENDQVGGKQTSKIILLVSDGEDFGEDTREALKEIKKNNIRLFTLGIGTEKGSKIATGRGGYKKDRQGNEVITKLNAEPLLAMADETNGRYFEISDKTNDISRLINHINAIEGELRDTRFIDVSANKYYYLLGMAILLLLVDILLSIKTVKLA